MTLELVDRARFDGNSILQQIQYHLADRVDLIGIGMCQHLLTFVLIGFFENTLQEWMLSA